VNTFGIKVTSDDNSEKFYVGEDTVLWDWLNADNYEESDFSSLLLKVPAPEGYDFRHGNLTPQDKVEEEFTSSEIWVEAPDAGKADLILTTLRTVEPEEFKSLNIDPSRILNVEDIKDIVENTTFI
jgi:hypothetical protein